MLWKDLQYIHVDKHNLECDWLLDIVRCFHSQPEDMGQRSADFDMLSLMDIHCLLYIQVDTQRRDLQNSQGCIDMIQQGLFVNKQHCFHKVKDCMDQLFLLLLVLK